MQITKAFSTATLGLGLALTAPLAAPLAAQEAQMTPGADAGTQYSSEQLTAFVTAAMAVNEVDVRYQESLAQADDPAEQQQLIESANVEMMSAVEETPGITLEEYMEIGQAAEANPELNAQLIAMLQDMQQQQIQ